jgi:hypothetical protein
LGCGRSRPHPRCRGIIGQTELAASRQLADLGLDLRSAHILRVERTTIPCEHLLLLAMAGPGGCVQELVEPIAPPTSSGGARRSPATAPLCGTVELRRSKIANRST